VNLAKDAVSMRWLICLASLMFAVTARAESIGVFTAVAGDVRVLRADYFLAAAEGVEVAREDIIETGPESSAQIDMDDGSSLKLGPESRLAISDYKLDDNKNVVSATLDVISGWLRFAVAKLKPSGRYSFNTPVLTVGVRGTEGTIDSQNEEGGLQLDHGAVDVLPVGGDFKSLVPVRVTTGQFIQRRRGQSLVKLDHAPSAFQRRVPAAIQVKLVRRIADLKRRNVPPKVIRALTREDAQRFVERHPHLRDKLRERFRPFGVKAPAGDTPAHPGIGGAALRERQLRLGAPGGATDASEALKRRYQEQQLRQGLVAPKSDTVPAPPRAGAPGGKPLETIAPSGTGVRPNAIVAPSPNTRPLAPASNPGPPDGKATDRATNMTDDKRPADANPAPTDQKLILQPKVLQPAVPTPQREVQPLQR
jgi:FecR protein